MEGLFDDGLVDDVLFCCGKSLEEDLRWEPRLGVFVDLAECDDDEANDGPALCKTVETFRGAFFVSTCVELKTSSWYTIFRRVLGAQLWLSDLHDHVCDQVNNLFCGKIVLVPPK